MHALRALASHHLVALALELLDWRHAARARLARLPQPQPPSPSTHARTERALLAAVSALEAAQQQNAQQGTQQPQPQLGVADQHSLQLQQQPARMTAAQRAWAAAIDIVVGQALLVALTNLTSASSSSSSSSSASSTSNTFVGTNATALPLPLALAIEAIGCAWIDASVGVRVSLHRSNAGSSSSSAASSTASNAVALAPSSSAASASASASAAAASLPPRSARRQSERLVFHVWSELVCLTRAAHSDSLAARWLHRIEDAGAANASTGASAAASASASSSQDPSLSSSSSPSSALAASLALPFSSPASIDVALRRLRALCFVELDLRHTDGLRHVVSDAADICQYPKIILRLYHSLPIFFESSIGDKICHDCKKMKTTVLNHFASTNLLWYA
jgi:hypothetical protein